MPSIRYHVKPRDAPAAIAARVLGITAERFIEVLPDLTLRGFPAADPTTGMYDLKAIERWQDLRHSGLFAADAPPTLANHARMVLGGRLRTQPGKQDTATLAAPINEQPPEPEFDTTKPLGKLELKGLEGYYRARGTTTHVAGAGLTTIGKLEARGFIIATGDGYGVSDHRITAAGEAAAQAIFDD